MKKIFIAIILVFSFILTSCGNDTIGLNSIENDIVNFKEKLANSDSYIYYNNIDVKLAKSDYLVIPYKRKITTSVDNLKKLFKLKLERNDNSQSFTNEYFYAERYGNIYHTYRYGSSYTMSYDCLSYYCTVDEFKTNIEESWHLNLENREKVFNIDNEITYSDGHYQVKYDFNDYKKALNDEMVDKYVEQSGELSDNVFVIVDYVFTETSMTIKHTFDLDGKDDEVIKGPSIVLETKYEIRPIVEIDLNPDTFVVTLTDINSNDISDASRFSNILVSQTSPDKGYFKIYLDKGSYNITVNSFHLIIDPSTYKCIFYNSNKEKIEENDIYNLEEGWYYVYLESLNRFSFSINKLD